MKRVILAGLFFFIYCYEISLNAQWVKSYGGIAWDVPHSIQQTFDGGYIVAGRTGSDFWILKLFSNGFVEWQKSYGGSGSDEAFSVQQTSDGGYIVAGYTSSSGAGHQEENFKYNKINKFKTDFPQKILSYFSHFLSLVFK